jgi:hypothetical protein
VEKVLEKVVTNPVLVEKLIEREVEYINERIVEKPVETRIEKIVERPVYIEVERIVEKPVERIVEVVVEKPVIVQKFVEREVQRVVEHDADEVSVTRRTIGKATEVEARFIEHGTREVEWVERSTGEHPDDDIVGDESTVFRARVSYVVDPNEVYISDPKDPRYRADDPRHRRS